jgi:uncharacterized membrane protein YoaK (UPF0700 family)
MKAQESGQQRTLPALLYLFTAVTGLIDAVSYIALGHVFTANMTGNIVFLGFASARVPGLSVLRSLTALVAFLLGALIGGRLAAILAPLSSNRWGMAAFGSEAVFLTRSNISVARSCLAAFRFNPIVCRHYPYSASDGF